MENQSSMLSDLTGVHGKWLIIITLMVLAAFVTIVIGCGGMFNQSDQRTAEKDKFERCIDAGKVWVDGNCLPASEVQG